MGHTSYPPICSLFFSLVSGGRLQGDELRGPGLFFYCPCTFKSLSVKAVMRREFVHVISLLLLGPAGARGGAGCNSERLTQ